MENKIREAIDEIKRGSFEIIDIEAIEKLIKRYFETGENFYVKAGFDPTAPDLHLGHTVLIQKLATFQKFGGIVQFLIGDFTATIGDPTGKSDMRKMLSKEEVIHNKKEVKELVKRGVAPSQLKSKGVGEAEATVPETASDAERLQDRKVEVKALN